MMDHRLRVYNTLTRQKEPFNPLSAGKVGIYLCGPTVYKPSHIGHMVGPVIFDTIKRYLSYAGYHVTWVVNITDVDDKLIVRARELGTTVKELAERNTADYIACLGQLHVTGIDRLPKATEHVPERIDIHGGGLDLQFPHHENELAQSESYTGQPFSRHWMHNGLLKMGHAKMAGSVGNVINVSDLLRSHSPETVRFLLLSTHYRSPIEYSDDRLHEIHRSLENFYRFFERYQRIRGRSIFQVAAPARHG